MGFKKEMQAMIIAGGLGTRLRPITKIIPKPMVSICNKPFLEYQINHLRKFPINKLILCVGYLGEKIEEYFKDGKNFGIDIVYSYEKEPLGTAGAIKNAEHLIDSNPFIVMNGDTYSKLNFQALFSTHKKNKNLVTMVITNASNPQEQELIESRNNLITGFYKRNTSEHKEYLSKNPFSSINAGIYIFDKQIFNLIPSKKKISLENDIFPHLIGQIQTFEYKDYMKDIANITFCNELENDILEGII